MRFLKRRDFTALEPLRGKVIPGKIIKLREKKLSDVRNDYQWQSDDELASLDAAPTLDVAFAVYLLDYSSVIYQKDHRRYPLAIETIDGKHIGNCTCYDIDEKKREAQVGIMIGDKNYWQKGYGLDALITLVDHVFMTSSFNRLYLKTLEWNKRAQHCFMKVGFSYYGDLERDGYHFLLMQLTREQWEKRRSNG